MEKLPVGLLYSTQGTYQHIGQNAYQGACYAIAEINRSSMLDVNLTGIHCDPQGVLDNYVSCVQSLLASGIEHVFGTITSSSRKEVLPDIQDSGALLWYSSPYEGYECDEQVIYHGACPNQNLYPLLAYIMPQYGKRACLIASNYIWGWESNRIASDLINVARGDVLHERFFHLTHIDFSQTVESICSKQPDFIVNNLVGESSYAFLEQLNSCWEGEKLPILSCNLTECELVNLPNFRNLRLLTAAPFFESVNPEFVSEVRKKLGDVPVSSMFMGAYLSVLSFARAYQKSKSGKPHLIRDALTELNYDSPLRSEMFLADNQHAHLPCYIGEWNGNYFDILHYVAAIKPNPFLTAESVLDIEMKGTLLSDKTVLRLIS